MTSSRFLPVLRIAFWLAPFCFAPSLLAQCGKNTPGYRDIGLVPGNPFQAEKIYKRTGATSALLASFEEHPELIARDSQGRVRIEVVAGKFKMDSGPDQGQQIEQHLIFICDPSNQTITQLDTLNKTAKITHSRGRQMANLSTPQITLCSFEAKRLGMGRSKVEDLGHQTIQGFDAQGFRSTLPPLLAAPEGHTVTTNTRDEWCTDELAVIIQETLSSTRDNHTFAQTEITLTKIERREPDLSLFQIPPDYTIGELVPPAARYPVLPGKAQPLQTPSSPQK